MRIELTPRSAAADRARVGRRLATGALDNTQRRWMEAGVGFLPFLAWLVSGITDTPSLAMVAYIAVAGMLVVRPQLGFLALLPMLPFYHAQAFPPYGPIFVLTGVALASVVTRIGLGEIRVPRSARPAVWCSLAFLALTTFQLFFGVDEFGGRIPLRALSQFNQVFITLSVFAVALALLSGKPFAPYRIAFIASFVIVSVVAILHFVEPRALNVLGLAWMVPPNAYEYRASGVIASPNALGLFLAAGLAWMIVTAVWHIAHERIDRATWLIPLMPPAALALLLSFSRAAIVALGVGLIAALARRSRRAAGMLAAAALVAAFLIYPIFVQVRLGQTFGEASPAGEAAFAESDRLRTLMATSAVEAFLDAPIAGHGFATFAEISPRYSGQSVLTSAHDMYLKVAAEQGIIGLGLLGALFVAIVVPLWRAGLGPWTASLAVVAAFATSSLTIDSFGSAQAVSGAFFLMAAGSLMPLTQGNRSMPPVGRRAGHDSEPSTKRDRDPYVGSSSGALLRGRGFGRSGARPTATT